MDISPQRQEDGTRETSQRGSDDGKQGGAGLQRSWSVTITPRTIWLAVAVIVATALIIFVLSKALDAVLLFFIAIIVAEGIRPLVNGLGRLHVPRPLAVLLIYLAILVIFIGLVWLLIQPIITQAIAFSNQVPAYLNQLQGMIGRLQQATNQNPDIARLLSSLEPQATGQVGRVLPVLLSVPVTLVGGVFSVLVVLTMAFFWLTSTPQLKPFVLGLLPQRQQERTAAIFAELSHNIGGYVRGVVVNMCVIGLLTGAGLFLLGVPYALLLGLLAGLTELIPFLGPWISGSVAVLVALAAVDPLKALEVLILFEVIQQVEGNTLVPLVMSRAVKLNPLVVIVAVITGGALLGILGAVLAVPVAVVIQVLVLRVLAPVAQGTARRRDEKDAAAETLKADAPVSVVGHV